MKINRAILILFLMFWGLSCHKPTYTTPIKQPLVLNKVPIKEQAPIIVYGDTRTNTDIHRKVVKAFIAQKPTLVFNTGDLVYDGNKKELWTVFFNIIKPIIKTARYYPVLGNHERQSENYFKLFDLPGNERWYEIGYQHLNFIMIDSNSDLSKGSKQYQWLEKTLQTNKKFNILIFHHPVLSVGRHGASRRVKDIIPLIEKYQVKLIFNGHDHAYQRLEKKGSTYIVTGGGGAPLYPMNADSKDRIYLKKYEKKHHYCLLKLVNKTLVLEAYTPENKLIDKLSMETNNKK